MFMCRGQHFQHLLWSVNCNYFIPNVTGQQPYWFISKIRMHLTASVAPVTMKCSALNRSTNVRTSLYKINNSTNSTAFKIILCPKQRVKVVKYYQCKKKALHLHKLWHSAFILRLSLQLIPFVLLFIQSVVFQAHENE
jgi:hypothetical protein